MPENDPQNAPHLTPRMAVPASSYGPRPGIPERVAALRIEELLAAGDTGGARHLLRETENGIGTHKDASPWRLLDHLLNLGMLRPRETAAGPDEAPAAESRLAASLGIDTTGLPD
ncbi:MAG: hypothetical protein ACRDOL_43535 [Streptosporangiaceae bacterium]